MQDCKDAGENLLELFWVETDKSADPAYKKIRSILCAREYKTKKHGKIQISLYLAILSLLLVRELKQTNKDEDEDEVDMQGVRLSWSLKQWSFG